MVIDKPRATSLKPVITKKRKIYPSNNLSLDDLDQESEVAKWLIMYQLKCTNVKLKFSALQETANEPTGHATLESAQPRLKPPPMYIEAQIIEPLTDLLDKIANENYTLKHFKHKHVKAQANATESYSKNILALNVAEKRKMRTSIPTN